MTRVALYARYSSKLQSPLSIDDQLRICGERAAENGWQVVESYSDRELSGDSLLLRTGIQQLLADAQAGRFDVVMAEAQDRVSRDQEDVAHIYKRLCFWGIRLITLLEGEINEMHVGIGGLMGRMFLKNLSQKTHRGLEGRVLAGKSAGGKAYGYDVVKKFDAEGKLIRGEMVINPAEADIINRIADEIIVGKSPRKLCFELNAEGVPAPGGKGWSPSTLYGSRRRGNGLINNELYIGIRVWNRQRFQKNPDTGKRISRMNPPELWKRVEVPELRILDPEKWEALKAFQDTLEMRDNGTPKEQRPRKLFSYLIHCGECGGGCSKISATHYGCSTARNKGTCSNRLAIAASKLEERVLGTLRSRLMNPDLCEAFCREYTDHINRLRRASSAARDQRQAELERIGRNIKKLVQAIVDGCDPRLIKDEVNALQRRKDELTVLLENTAEAPVFIHPNMAHRYHAEIQRLMTSLNNPEHRDESAQLIRKLIDKIVLTPNEDRTTLAVDLHGDLAGILQMSLKPGQGFTLNRYRRLSEAQSEEVQQIREVIGGIGGAGPLPESFLSQQVGLVAGAGFEPATFRL